MFKETLCAHANDAESNRSSLEDFLDKCQAAVAQSKIGGWNIRAVEDRAGKQFIAVHMPSVWSVVDKAFLPSYSRSIVESGILKAGGNKRGTQKFYRSEDETKTYLRACIQPQGENTSIPKEPVMVPRKCVVIPASLSWDLYEAIIPPRVEDLAVPEPELPQLPPVTTSCQGGGNSPNSNGEGVSSPQSQSVTKNKKESVLEKETEITHTPASGDIDGVLSSKKVVTQPTQGTSNASGDPVSAVTKGVVTGGNSMVTEPESSNSPLADPISARADALKECQTWPEVLALPPVLQPINKAAWNQLYHHHPEHWRRLEDIRLSYIDPDEVEWED